MTLSCPTYTGFHCHSLTCHSTPHLQHHSTPRPPRLTLLDHPGVTQGDSYRCILPLVRLHSLAIEGRLIPAHIVASLLTWGLPSADVFLIADHTTHPPSPKPLTQTHGSLHDYRAAGWFMHATPGSRHILQPPTVVRLSYRESEGACSCQRGRDRRAHPADPGSLVSAPLRSDLTSLLNSRPGLQSSPPADLTHHGPSPSPRPVGEFGTTYHPTTTHHQSTGIGFGFR